MTHPRTQYLADAHDPARQPLLQDSEATSRQDAAESSNAQHTFKGSKESPDQAPSAPPLDTSESQTGPTAAAPVAEYGLPAGYQAHYAGHTHRARQVIALHEAGLQPISTALVKLQRGHLNLPDCNLPLRP